MRIPFPLAGRAWQNRPAMPQKQPANRLSASAQKRPHIPAHPMQKAGSFRCSSGKKDLLRTKKRQEPAWALAMKLLPFLQENAAS